MPEEAFGGEVGENLAQSCLSHNNLIVNHAKLGFDH